MANDLSFIPFFITEDLFLLPEDRQQKGILSSEQAQKQAPAPAAKEAVKQPSPLPTATAVPKVPSAAEKPPQPAEKANPSLVFGKNLKNLLILVEDPDNPVMERADGLFLKDVLKAVQYTFDDVAIVNIAHCRTEADWEAINAISFTHLFSFGVAHPELPATRTLAPYELERSGERFFLKTEKLAVLRTERAHKITLWNLLKKMFV